MSDLLEKIRSQAHWIITIRPATFIAERVPYADLSEIIPAVEVRFRGWPVPLVNYYRHNVLHGDDWVGQDIDADVVSMYEAWRFFMSGQFAHLRSISADWRTASEATAVPIGGGSPIEVWEILFYLTEVFELAARLALGPAGDDVMVIEATLENIENHVLVVGQRGRLEFSTRYAANVPSLSREVELPRENLIADGRLAAAVMAREFFLRFGWKPSVDQLLDHQRELTERQR